MVLTVSDDSQLGPQARPPFMVRFGIWVVLAILGVVSAIGSLISYRDRFNAPVHFTTALPVRAAAGPGRIHFQVRDGDAIDTNDVIARLQPRDSGVVVTMARIPSPLSSTIHRGDTLICDIGEGHRIVRRLARVDAVVAATADAISVRLVVSGRPANGILHVAGEEQSVLRRLMTSLLKR
jgi:hypothetical protein